MAEVVFNDVHTPLNSTVKGALKLSADGIVFKDKKGASLQVQSSDVSSVEWLQLPNDFEFRVIQPNGFITALRGFAKKDKETLQAQLQQLFNVQLQTKSVTVRGLNFGDAMFQGNTLKFEHNNKTTFEIPGSDIAQAVLQPKSKNEVAIEMHAEDTANFEDEQLCEIRWWIPGKLDDTDMTPAKKFQSSIIQKVGIDSSTNAAIVNFPQLNFHTPRGRYDISMFGNFLKLHGKSYDYNIRYASIVQLYKLPRVDLSQDLVLIALDPPVRQGATTYPYLVISFPRGEQMKARIQLDEEKIQKFEGKLNSLMEGEAADVVVMTLRGLSGKKLITTTPYKNHRNECAIRCSLKQNDGSLYLLEKRFLFVFKPIQAINYKDVASVEFARMSTFGSSNRTVSANFDLYITISDGTVVQFSNIHRSEYDSLVKFIQEKSIKVVNIARPERQSVAATVDHDDAGGEHDSEDDDDDFAPAADSSGDEPDMGDGSDNEGGEEMKRKAEGSAGKPSKRMKAEEL
eukprot:c5299_g1_i1.p1 GENE.c5299_g1_i1~~c5299_g1_i1.p1  ORF type:complete len:533 (+),score=146.06 c5299_g1_i1:58-1599(+)